MTIEQKAKAYEDALKRAEAVIKIAQNQKEVYGCITTIFPELKESEEEIIKKMIINHLTQERGSLSNEDTAKIIAWLEKQGEQKLLTVDDCLKALSKIRNKQI